MRAAARKRVSPTFLRAIQHAARNIRRVAEKQLPRPWSLEVEPGVTVCQLVRPIDSIGCYIPGGRFALVSTMLMTVVPAQVAGVKNIASSARGQTTLSSPPQIFSASRKSPASAARKLSPLSPMERKTFLASKKSLAPAIASSPPRNNSSAADCAIDLPAGPTEAIVLAAKGNRQMDRRRLTRPSRTRSGRGQFSRHAVADAGARRPTTKSLSQLANLPLRKSRSPLHAQDRRDPACAFARTPLRVRQSLRAGTSQPSGQPRARSSRKSPPPEPSSSAPGARSLSATTLRQQSRPSHRRLGAQARRPFRRRLREMHQRANHLEERFPPPRRRRANLWQNPKACSARNAVRIRR